MILESNEGKKNSKLISFLSKLKSFWFNSSKKTKLLIIFIIFLFIVSIDFINFCLNDQYSESDTSKKIDTSWQKYTPEGANPPFFSLIPKTESTYGILPQESFILTCQEPIDMEFVRQNLQTDLNFDIKPISNNQFEINIDDNIGTDQLVTIGLKVKDQTIADQTFNRNYNWAFQTQPKFSVNSVLPGDKKTNVPVNTGIEFVFNQDGYQDPSKYISIEPKIDWQGETHGQTYSVVPQNPLSPKTIYTITLKKGLNLLSRDDSLSQDLVFSFQTEDIKKPSILLSLSKNSTQVSTQEPAQVAVWSSNWPQDYKIQTKIFKFANISQFIESRKEIDKSSSYWYTDYEALKPVDSTKLSLIAQADISIQTQDEVQLLSLPEPLPFGFYLVEFWYDNNQKVEQLWLQSTDVSAYTSVGRKQTLVWANDVSSNLPVKDALVSAYGSSVTYQTSIDGITVFDTPQIFHQKSIHYIQINSNQGELALPVTSLSEQVTSQQKTAADYWSYLYNERYLYKPGDTLYFWGVIKDRDTNQIPANVNVSIASGYSQYEPSSGHRLLTTNVYPSSDGSFMASLKLDDLPLSYYSLLLTQDDQVINSTSFSIEQYQKPELKIEVVANKVAVFTGEKVNYSAKIGFFDGTPAKNIDFQIASQYTNAFNSPKSISTNKNGQISYTYQPEYDTDAYRYPRYENITISPSLVQKENIEGYGSVLVYGQKLSITPEKRQENDKAILSAVVNRVTLDNLNSGSSTDTKGDVVANQEVNLTIIKTWWEKIENGTYYDFIEKVTRKSYKYVEHKEKITDTKLKTDNQGKIDYSFTMEKQKTYQAVLSLEDEDKHPVTSNLYFYYYRTPTNEDKYTYPELTFTQKDKKEYSLGDKVDLEITYKNEIYPDTDKNKFLFIVAQMGQQDFFIKDSPVFNFEFSQKHIPNTYTSAIIFTGKHYQIATPGCYADWYCSWWQEDNYFQSLLVPYNQLDSQLDISITTDKDKYLPEDDVKITALVKKDGQPISGAQVNLTLVDQALAAINGVKKPSILSSLYSDVPHQIYYNYFSHKPVSGSPPAAEKGGGGGEDRQIFKDTPYFGQTRTNENGQAIFEFELSDNITTWLIFAQGLTENLLAGHTESKLVATKDFFVTSNFPPEYLTKDTAYASGNSFGNVDTNQTIDYQVSVLDNNKQISDQSFQGKASIDVSTKFPDLLPGDYQIRLRGKFNDLSDGIILPFSVISSRLDISSNQTLNLSKGQSVNGLSLPNINTDKPVKLIITDTGYGKYYHQLYNFCYVNSNRVERNLAQIRANQIIKDRFDEEPCKVNVKDLSSFQNSDGGLAQVNWGSSDLKTTVWSIFVDSSPFDKDSLISYLENQVKQAETTNDKIYALWGLSLLGQPKLNQLYGLSQTVTSFEDQVIVALALASQADTEISLNLYQDILTKYIYSNKPYFRIQASQDASQNSTDNYINDTGLFLLLGSMVDKSINDGLNLYLHHFSYQAEDIVVDLSRLSYINQELDKLPNEDTIIAVSSPKGNQTIDLSKGRRKTISLNGDQVSRTKITVDSGQAEINSLYQLSPDTFDQIKTDNRLSISRTYQKVSGEGSAITPGDIVKVQIDFDLDYDKAPLDCYTITDHLPSGLSYIDNPGMYGFENSWWLSQPVRNVLKSGFCNSSWWQTQGDKQIIYYAKALAVGNYLAEPAVLQSRLDLSILQSTSMDNINIEPQDDR